MESELVMAEQRVFRGAKVRRPANPLVDGPPITVAHPQSQERGAIGYEIAFANRHKSWAKRWFRQHRPGKFV